MKPNEFSVSAKAYILSLIRMRNYLDKHHLSKGDIAVFQEEINFLKKHLLMNGYNTDRQMAGFWMRHHDKISCLIPGKNCSSSAALSTKFYELKAEAGRLFTQYMIQPQILNQNGNSEVRF